MKEIWKPIKDYEGLYEVSNFGKVKSIPRNGTIKETKILKQYIDRYGYLYVALSKNDSQKKKKVHRLVAEAFIPNPENKPEVNHKWGIKTDNRASELEWATTSENLKHAIENKLRKTRNVVQYNRDGELIKKWSSSKEASKALNIDDSSIYKCCKGKRKTVGGYIWRYENE